MVAFSCVIQEGSAAHQRGEELERRLRAHHDRHVPGDPVTVSWVPIRATYMFTEGRQSTSSVVSCAIPKATTLEFREAYMRGVCDIWTEVTDCTDHEVVVSISETV
ncbi:MAG: hypothetical protein AAF467_07515 [Actinomycetota bacterium]